MQTTNQMFLLYARWLVLMHEIDHQTLIVHRRIIILLGVVRVRRVKNIVPL